MGLHVEGGRLIALLPGEAAGGGKNKDGETIARHGYRTLYALSRANVRYRLSIGEQQGVCTGFGSINSTRVRFGS